MPMALAFVTILHAASLPLGSGSPAYGPFGGENDGACLIAAQEHGVRVVKVLVNELRSYLLQAVFRGFVIGVELSAASQFSCASESLDRSA